MEFVGRDEGEEDTDTDPSWMIEPGTALLFYK